MSTGMPGVRGQGADHVVGLVAVGAHDRDPERPQHLDDHRDLRLERVGHLLDVRRGPRTGGHHPVPLVRREQVDAPLRTPVVVPAAHQVGRLVVGDQPGDELQQPAHGVDRLAVG
jgi:hypothetical protein